MDIHNLVELLRENNPSYKIKVMVRGHRNLVIFVDCPPEQLILPDGYELIGPDVGDRQICNKTDKSERFVICHCFTPF